MKDKTLALSIMVVDIFGIIYLLVLSLSDLKSSIIIFISATLVFMILMITWCWVCGSIFNFFTIIQALMYLYYFGQYTLKALNIPIEQRFRYTIVSTFPISDINKTALYILFNIIVLHMSTVFFWERETSEFIYKEKVKINKNMISLFVNIMLPVSFICKAMVLIDKIRINTTFGYLKALNSSYNGAGRLSYIVYFISTLFLPVFFLSLVAERGKKKIIIIILLYISYLLMYFMSGSRFEAIISVAGVFLLIHFYYHKFSWKEFTVLILCGFIFLFLCSYMSNIRRFTNNFELNSFVELLSKAWDETLKNNFLADVFCIAGQTMLANTAIYKHCPSEIPYSYGMYYLQGALRIIPNIFGGENQLITDSIDTMFSQYLTRTYGMGSSFIIEAYYNFGWIGIGVMVIYGWLSAIVCRAMEELRNRRQSINLIRVSFIFYIASVSMFYVRSDARMLLREIVFYYFGIYFLVIIINLLCNRRLRIKNEK